MNRFSIINETAPINEVEATSGLIGFINATHYDTQRMDGAKALKFTATNGADTLVFCLETVSSTSDVLTLTVFRDETVNGAYAFRRIELDGSYGDYIKANGETVSKWGAGYGLTTSTPDADVAEVMLSVLWQTVDEELSTAGKLMRDPKALAMDLPKWHHDYRFINGGCITGGQKVLFA